MFNTNASTQANSVPSSSKGGHLAHLACLLWSELSMEFRDVLPRVALNDNGPPPVRSVPPPVSSSNACRFRYDADEDCAADLCIAKVLSPASPH